MDEQQIPLPGANVKIKGSDDLIETDFDGKFSVDAHIDDILEISFLCYITETITISSKKTEIISMEIDKSIEVFTVGGIGYRRTFWSYIQFYRKCF